MTSEQPCAEVFNDRVTMICLDDIIPPHYCFNNVALWVTLGLSDAKQSDSFGSKLGLRLLPRLSKNG